MGKELSLNILEIARKVQKLEEAGGGGGSADSAKRSDIATEFSTTTAYTAGCFVYHGGKLYQFNTDHSAGAWDPTDVVAANVTDQVVSNASAIAGLTASDVAYDNTDSELTATDVQGAVDELSEIVENVTESSGFDTGVQLASTDLPYTMLKSGYIRVAIPGTQPANTYMDLIVNSQVLKRFMKYNSNDVGCTDSFILKKGDIITNVSNITDGTVTVFYYA